MEGMSKRVLLVERQNCVSYTYRIDTNGKTSSLYFLFENVELFLEDVKNVDDIKFPQKILTYLSAIVKSKEEGEDEEEDDEEEVDYTNVMRHLILENTLSNNSRCLSIEEFVAKTQDVALNGGKEKYKIPIPNWIWKMINNAPENNEENDEEEEKKIEDKLKPYNINVYLKTALAKLYQNREQILIEQINNNFNTGESKQDVEPKKKVADVVQEMTQLRKKLGGKIPEVDPVKIPLPIDPKNPNDEDLANVFESDDESDDESENGGDWNSEKAASFPLPDDEKEDESKSESENGDDWNSEKAASFPLPDDGEVVDEKVKCKKIIDELKEQRQENEVLRDDIKRIIERTNASRKFTVKLRF